MTSIEARSTPARLALLRDISKTMINCTSDCEGSLEPDPLYGHAVHVIVILGRHAWSNGDEHAFRPIQVKWDIQFEGGPEIQKDREPMWNIGRPHLVQRRD